MVEDHAERTKPGYKHTFRNTRHSKDEIEEATWTKLGAGVDWNDRH